MTVEHHLISSKSDENYNPYSMLIEQPQSLVEGNKATTSVRSRAPQALKQIIRAPSAF
jgi:hypothetical protein